jgi:hypothetical protein
VSTVICVLGMSRSGTSLTTRVLSLAGVYLGPDDELLGDDLRQLAGEGEEVLARASAANPEGFWEHYRLMRLNERILRSLGGNWRDPPSMAPGWESSEELAAEREEARAMLAESFDGHDLWAWKDPRNCLTLPFWQRLLPEMRYVICLRNPVDIAASLQRRDGMSLAEGLELWLVYTAAALFNTSGRRRLLVPYESYFGDPSGTVARLARFVGRDGALEGDEPGRRLDEAINHSLWRNRSSVRDAVVAESMSVEAASLYLVTQLLAVAEAGDNKGSLSELNEAADLYAGELMGKRCTASTDPMR